MMVSSLVCVENFGQVNAVTLGVCNTMSNIGGFLALVSFQVGPTKTTGPASGETAIFSKISWEALPTKITQNLRLTILTTTTLASSLAMPFFFLRNK